MNTKRGNTIIAGNFREDGRRYQVRLEYREGPAQLREHGRTVTHEPIREDALEVAITGETWYATANGNRDLRYRDCMSAGQNVEDLRKVPGPRAARIASLWDRWHLNGMKAACAHQQAEVDRIYREMPGYDRDGERWNALRRITCPEGYAYGSAWLYEPIPDDVLAELRQLFGIRTEE